MTYSTEHGINPVDPGILFYEIDTVTIKLPLTFDQISEMLNIPREELQFLNPAYKQGVIPATSDNHYILRLSKKYIGDFINNESALYTYKTRKGQERDSLMALVIMNNRETKEYIVRSGETMSGIAKKFRMTVTELKSLNNLKKNYVKPKQRLLVYVGSPKKHVGTTEVTTTSLPDAPVKESDSLTVSAPKYHTVKSGETLSKIAQKYDCSVNNLTTWNNLKSTNIVVGQKLKLYGTTAVASTSQGTSSTTAKTSSSSSKFAYYTIKSGDNLWEIAEKFDVTVSQIKKANNIKNVNRLKPGQRIKIPK
jgi:membrane-bound lytic murein transglycosylase D